jgi:hypothetical protein
MTWSYGKLMRPAGPTGSPRRAYLSILSRVQLFFNIKNSYAPSVRPLLVFVSVPEFRDNAVSYVHSAYITASGTGYAQQNFSHACSSCAFEITREKLAVAKLTTDLTAHLLHESQLTVADGQLFLPYAN